MDNREYQTQVGSILPDKAQAPPAWASHVLIPVAQNAIGGLAVAGLALMGVYGFGGDIEGVAGVWCGFSGAVVTCAVTITRFFGDDWGIVAAAYRLGQRSRDGQIAALELRLRSAIDAQMAGGVSAATMIRKDQEEYQRAKEDAKKILSVWFGGDRISRSAMRERGMGQRDYERAIRLLMAINAMNDAREVTVKNPAVAIRAMDDEIAGLADKGKTYTPAWK